MALLRTEKQGTQRGVTTTPTERVARTVQEAQVYQNIHELQVEITRPAEANDLITWERQYAEQRQTELLNVAMRQEGVVHTDVPREMPELLTQPEDTARIAILIDEIPPVALESEWSEIGREETQTAIIDGLETLIALEDFDVDNIVLEQPEKPLSTDDISVETGIFEEDETCVDALLADLEEGMQLIEAHYMGELLVGVFADFVETDVMNETEEVAGTRFSQAMTSEIVTEVSDSTEPIPLQDIEAEFSLYLESLEPTQLEEIKNMIETLGIAINDSQQLPEEATTEEEVIEEKLEELCIQLFESLGIEYDEEIIKQFMHSIAAQESVLNMNIDTNELSIDDLNNMGTHEYKPLDNASLLGGLTQFIKQKLQPHLMLGRYALQVSTI
ncbi:MAG TPA: hypothetical protein VMR34_04135 [Candidatus Saccharimonadales bacterium]|nr:hypothetical protein [Candidatus Saccharimonadales bacterium]